MTRRRTDGRRWRALWGLVLTLSSVGALEPHAAADQTGQGSTSTVADQGVRLTLSVPEGPYFLGELLPVTIAVANLSPRPVFPAGPLTLLPCGAAAGVSLSGGRAPFVRLPRFQMSCPGLAGVGPGLEAGHGATIPLPLPLTASGAVTLTASVALLTTTVSQGQHVTTRWDPFRGRLPVVVLHVSPRVPPARRLALSKIGPAVFVRAPLAARLHLVSLFVVSCHDPQGPGMTFTGSPLWQPLPAGVADDPGCPGVREQWAIAVGAPGYAIAVGTFAGRGENPL